MTWLHAVGHEVTVKQGVKRERCGRYHRGDDLSDRLSGRVELVSLDNLGSWQFRLARGADCLSFVGRTSGPGREWLGGFRRQERA